MCSVKAEFTKYKNLNFPLGFAGKHVTMSNEKVQPK